MAAAIGAGQIIEVKTFCQSGAQQGINVLHYRVSAIIGAPDTDQAVATNLDGSFAPLYKAWLPAASSYKGLRLQILFPGPTPVAVTAVGNAGVGAQAADPLPNVACLLVKKSTALAGVRNRGRAYLPFWSEASSGVAGAPSAGALTFAQNWANFAMVPINVVNGAKTTTLVPVIYHKDTNTTTDISSVTLRFEWATQRKRSMINRGDIIGP